MAIFDLIPLSTIQLHEQVASDFIRDLGKTVTLHYPAIRITCPNCYGGYTYNGTGPNPFPQGQPCSICGGTNNIAQAPESEDITCMVYMNPKDFIQYQDLTMQLQDGLMQIRGKMSDLIKVQRCNSCTVVAGIEGIQTMVWQKLGEAIPYGVRLQSEFLQTWKRKP